MSVEPKIIESCASELSFGDRVDLVLKEQRRSKVWLSEQLTISKQNLNYILRHSCKPKYLHAISESLNIQEQWLREGRGPKHIDTHQGYHEIPVLPMLLNQNDDQERPAPKMSLIVGKHLDPACFAVQLTNASMDPTFQKGTFLIFDPNRIPKDVDFVCLSLKEQQGLLFRQIHIDAGDVYFKAINKMYRIIHNEPHIIHGVLVEARMRF